MDNIGTTKQTTLEEQSEIVRTLSEDIMNRLDQFSSYPKSCESDKKDMPAPKLDAIAQISEHLKVAEQNLMEISQQFDRLKARIRQ